MTEIIPSINCDSSDPDCLAEKISAAERFAAWAHLDIADGVFTYHTTRNRPGEWRGSETNLRLEVHLMVADPGGQINKWLWAGAKRVIVPVETLLDPEPDIAKLQAACASYGAELVLSSSPETPAIKLQPFLDKFPAFHCLSVHPGPSGQNFIPLVLDKIKWLRQAAPGKSIEVDGGINLENARRAREAGADRLVVGAYLWDRLDPSVAYRELQMAANR